MKMESLENFMPGKEIDASSEAKMEIKPVGSFLETDENGFIVNPAKLEKVQSEYEPVFEDIIDLYKQRFGESLKSVYVRGSVAKGRAIEGVSDIDFIAFVDLPKNEINDFKQGDDQEILEKYPFISKTELIVEPISKSISHNYVILLNQAICVYGKDIEVPKIRPGKEAMMHLQYIHEKLAETEAFFNLERSEQRIKSKCAGLMKKIVRSGCELVMERSGKYTRDLYLSYEVFSEYYPEKSAEMLEALDLALNPTADKEKIKSVVNNLSNWLSAEYRKNYQESEAN